MNLQNIITNKKILLSDGAWGTELAKKGYGGGICPELLNVEQPDVVREVAQSYVDTKADLIITNTFGGSPWKLAKYGLDDRLEELNKAGVRLSKETAGDSVLVFATLGPTGEFLAPLGTVTDDEMTAGFARQVKAFVAGGVDCILIESMTDLGETLCGLRAAKEHAGDLPVVCSMTFDKGLKGFATMMGVKPADAVRKLEEAGADVVGSNCGWGIDEIIEVAKIMREATGLPLWFKPNAGMPELVMGKTIYRQTSDYMASRIPDLIAAGASIVGGCCGSTPEHIRKIRKAVDSYPSKL